MGAERPEEPQLQYGEAEYDLLLSSCSAVYSERNLIQRLVASVRVASCYEDDEDNNLGEEAENEQQLTQGHGMWLCQPKKSPGNLESA